MQARFHTRAASPEILSELFGISFFSLDVIGSTYKALALKKTVVAENDEDGEKYNKPSVVAFFCRWGNTVFTCLASW